MKASSTDNRPRRYESMQWVKRFSPVLQVLLLIFSYSIALESQIRLGGGAIQEKALPQEWQTVEKTIGKSGSMQPGDVFKIALPETILKLPFEAFRSVPYSLSVPGSPSRRAAT